MKASYIFREAIRESYKQFLFSCGSRSLRFVPLHPASACINATHNCNSKCITCTMWRIQRSGELTASEMIDIMKQLEEIGVRRIGWSGGEVLLRKDLSLFVKTGRELGFEKIGILTNGLILNDGRARELLESGLNRISISIDGIGEVHDKQRGVTGAFERSYRAVKLLVDFRDRKYRDLDITVSTTLTELTINYVPKIVEICKELNVTWNPNILETVSFQFRGIDKSPLAIKDSKDIDKMIAYLHSLKGPPLSRLLTHSALQYAQRYLCGEDSPELRRAIPCVAGFQSIYINAYGNVYPGCWAMPPIGSLRKNNLKTILFSHEYRERLGEMFTKKCPYCTNSLITNIWYHVPSLFKELTWKAVGS